MLCWAPAAGVGRGRRLASSGGKAQGAQLGSGEQPRGDDSSVGGAVGLLGGFQLVAQPGDLLVKLGEVGDLLLTLAGLLVGQIGESAGTVGGIHQQPVNRCWRALRRERETAKPRNRALLVGFVR